MAYDFIDLSAVAFSCKGEKLVRIDHDLFYIETDCLELRKVALGTFLPTIESVGEIIVGDVPNVVEGLARVPRAHR